MNNTKIAWTEKTWNPWSGCRMVSEGCANCYAEEFAERMFGTRAFPRGFELTMREKKLDEPLRLKEPARIFVGSMTDFFFESVPDEMRDRAMDVIEQTPQHTYQILTKRASRALTYTQRRRLPRNVWIGVSGENQYWTDIRIDLLRRIDASVRFLSAAPLLERVHLASRLDGIHWVIVEAESGPKARFFAEDWARTIRDDCQAAGVAFFYKQLVVNGKKITLPLLDGRQWAEYPNPERPVLDSVETWR